jgi:hypothetical protein
MKLRGLGDTPPKQFIDWMSGYCGGLDDLPDGAWQAWCEEGVAVFNKDCGTHIDPHDGWLYWVNNKDDYKTPIRLI